MEAAVSHYGKQTSREKSPFRWTRLYVPPHAARVLLGVRVRFEKFSLVTHYGKSLQHGGVRGGGVCNCWEIQKSREHVMKCVISGLSKITLATSETFLVAFRIPHVQREAH